jgi:hypothetical protein
MAGLALLSLSPFRKPINETHMTDSSPKFQFVIRGVTFVPPSKAWVQVHANPALFSVGSTLVLSTAKSKMI